MFRLRDIVGYTCRADTPLREVMLRFNEQLHLFMVVVDEAGRPLGTITDGDLRRSILRGQTVDAVAASAMNDKPRIGYLGQSGNPVDQLKGGVIFLPMVDSNGILAEIWLPSAADEAIEDALVMAGGYGRRLGERTRNTPKPLLEVAEKPLLEHMLGWLENGGVKRIFVAVHYLADQIEDYLKARQTSTQHEIIRETEPLGTAGAVAYLAERVKKSFLVVNADVLTKLDIGAFTSFHHRHGYDGTLAVAPHVVEIPFGVIRQDEDGNFDGIDEKPRYSHFVSSGIYLLSSEFCSLVPRGQRFDMPELLNSGSKAGLRIGLFPIHEYWRDVGRETDFQSAQCEI